MKSEKEQIVKKIALDIHGVIDHDPKFFSWLSNKLYEEGWEIHILTGGKFFHNEGLLHDHDIAWHTFFSITDKHIELGTPMQPGTCDGDICIADEIWDKEKGDYCLRNDILILVDDTIRYKKYMPDFTHFFHYTEKST